MDDISLIKAPLPNQSAKNTSTEFFVAACGAANISIKDGTKYRNEILRDIKGKFRIDFWELPKAPYSIKLGMGLFIREKSRGLNEDPKVRFSGNYFTRLYLELIAGPDASKLVSEIEFIECKSPRIWTQKNMANGPINATLVAEKVRRILEVHEMLKKSLPEEFSVQLNLSGGGIIISGNDDQIVYLGNCTGLPLAKVSKHEGQIIWDWELKGEETKLDLAILTPYFPDQFLLPKLTLTPQKFYTLCGIVALSLGLDYIPMTKFADDFEIPEMSLIGMRDIRINPAEISGP